MEDIIRVAHMTDNHVDLPNDFTDEEWSKLNLYYRVILRVRQSSNHYNPKLFQKALENCAKEKIDHLIHTGDVGLVTLLREFQIAREYFDKYFVNRLPGSFKDLITIAPGNHDYYRKGTLSNDFFMETFGDMSPNGAFPFVKLVGGFVLLIVFRARHEDDLGWTSAGSITKEDIQEATRQLEKYEKKFSNINFIKIAMMHPNPIKRDSTWNEYFKNLRISHQKLMRKFLIDKKIDICMCGHTHRWRISKQKETGDTLLVDAGTVNGLDAHDEFKQEEARRPGFFIVTLKKDRGIVKLIRKIWDGEEFKPEVIFEDDKIIKESSSKVTESSSITE